MCDVRVPPSSSLSRHRNRGKETGVLHPHIYGFHRVKDEKSLSNWNTANESLQGCVDEQGNA